MVTIISIIIVVALYMMLGIAVVAVAFMLSLFQMAKKSKKCLTVGG